MLWTNLNRHTGVVRLTVQDRTVRGRNQNSLPYLTRYVTNYTAFNVGQESRLLLAFDSDLIPSNRKDGIDVIKATFSNPPPGFPSKWDKPSDLVVHIDPEYGYHYISLGSRIPSLSDLIIDPKLTDDISYSILAHVVTSFDKTNPDTSCEDKKNDMVVSVGHTIKSVSSRKEDSMLLRIPKDWIDNVMIHHANSQEGFCGSLLYGPRGVIGMHIGGDKLRRHNYFYAFRKRADITRVYKGMKNPNLQRVSSDNDTLSSLRSSILARSNKINQSRATTIGESYLDTSNFVVESKRDDSFAVLESSLLELSNKVKKEKGKTKSKLSHSESIVSMSPAPSDYIGPSPSTGGRDIVKDYIDTLLNPWSTNSIRLPDHVITPTSVAKFFANRTYTIGHTSGFGPNILFGLNTRLSCFNANPGASDGSAYKSPDGLTVGVSAKYPAVPGNILEPLQWGVGAYSNPNTNYVSAITGATHASTVWSDDYGASLASTLPFVSAYRTLAAAIRVRVVGLPPSQFMTPGKIYFAQVRYDLEDLPATEQDFVTLEQLGRATHVSADAVREAGSKTIFMTPDGAEKFGMVSNFVMAPGIQFDGSSGYTATYVRFPTASQAIGLASAQPTLCSALSAVVPYTTKGDNQTNAAANLSSAIIDNSDMANADSTSLLIVGYFGASDGVVLEVDYANVVEYIPNKKSPAGVEALVQLPNASAMDAIFSASAVCSQYRPLLIQSSGDKTITASVRSVVPTQPENSRVRAELAKVARRKVGATVREDWDDFLRGSVGLGWDFSGKRGDDYTSSYTNAGGPSKRK